MKLIYLLSLHSRSCRHSCFEGSIELLGPRHHMPRNCRTAQNAKKLPPSHASPARRSASAGSGLNLTQTLALQVSKNPIACALIAAGNVAQAMASGAITRTGASLAVAITGVTGSVPDEEGNPVRLVYCSVARAGGGTKARRIELR